MMKKRSKCVDCGKLLYSAFTIEPKTQRKVRIGFYCRNCKGFKQDGFEGLNRIRFNPNGKKLIVFNGEYVKEMRDKGF